MVRGSGALMVCSELCATEVLATASFLSTGKLPVPNHRPEASENIVQQVKSEAQHYSQMIFSTCDVSKRWLSPRSGLTT